MRKEFQYLASGEPTLRLEGDWLQNLFSWPLRLGVCNGYFKSPEQEDSLDHFHSRVVCKLAAVTSPETLSHTPLALLQTYWTGLRSAVLELTGGDELSSHSWKCQGAILWLWGHSTVHSNRWPEPASLQPILTVAGPGSRSKQQIKNCHPSVTISFQMQGEEEEWEGRGGITKPSLSSIQHKTRLTK